MGITLAALADSIGAELRGDAGARAVLRDSRFRLSSVPFEPASVDIDTTADLAAQT